ncbi:unnamed protein product, partial [Mesorhabditis belari]
MLPIPLLSCLSILIFSLISQPIVVSAYPNNRQNELRQKKWYNWNGADMEMQKKWYDWQGMNAEKREEKRGLNAYQEAIPILPMNLDQFALFEENLRRL